VFAFFWANNKFDKRILWAAVVSGGSVVLSLLPILKYILRNATRTSIWIPEPEPLFFVEYMAEYVRSPYLEMVFLCLMLFGVSHVFVQKKIKDLKTRFTFC
jgi:hypothetical protein